MPLVQLENHPLVAVLDLAEALENVDCHVGYVWVILQSESFDLLCADHVQLEDGALAHLFLQIVREGLLRLRLGLALAVQRILGADGVLTESKFLHHFLKLRVEVGGQVSINLSLHLLIRAVCEQVLLV